MQPKITIGSIVRDRAWILPEYLKAIYNLDYPKEKIDLHFIINDSTDGSEHQLRKFTFKHRKEYNKGRVTTMNFDAEADLRVNRADKEIYKNLAILRNKLLDYALVHNHSDYLFSIDTDIIVRSGTLKKLIAHNKDIVAALGKNSKRTFNAGYLAPNNINSINHLTLAPKGLRKVDWTGAVCLYKTSLLQRGLQFSNNSLGEDIGLALNAKALGVKMWVDGTEVLEHRMKFYNIDGTERDIRDFIKEEK